MNTTAVVDACSLVDALLPGERGDAVRAVLVEVEEIAAPEHLGIEVLSVLRRISLRSDSPTLNTARRTLVELHLASVPLADLQERIWALRHTLSAYDAAYVAAAEHLGVPLITSDRAISACPGVACTVVDPRRTD